MAPETDLRSPGYDVRSFTLRRLPTRLKNSRFARRASILAGSSAAARFLVVAVSPILTRLYDPEALGFLAVFSGILAPLIGVSSLRYEFALLTIDDPAEGRSIYRLSIWLVCLLSGVSAGLGILFMPLAGEVFHNQYAPWLLPLVGAGLLGGGYYNVLTHYALRQQEFGPLGVSRIVQGVSSATTQVLGGALVSGPWGLLMGTILGHAGGSIGLRRRLHRRSDSLGRGPYLPVFRVAKHHWRYPALGAPAVLLYRVSEQGPALLLAFLFGPSAAGSYLLADRVIGVPVKMATSAVAQTFAADAGNSVRTVGSVGRRRVLRTSALMGGVIAPPIVLVAFSAKWAFPIIFGSGWELAGAITQIVALELMFRGIVLPVTQTYLLSGRHKFQLVLESVRVLASLGGLGIPWMLGASLLETLKYYVAAMVGTYVVAMLFALRAAERVTSDGSSLSQSGDV